MAQNRRKKQEGMEGEITDKRKKRKNKEILSRTTSKKEIKLSEGGIG
jgi:hypothetical protein